MADGLVERARALSRPLEPIPTGVEPRLPDLERIRAVLFDIYGTLLVSGSGDVGTAAATDSADALAGAFAAAGFGDVSGETARDGVARMEAAIRRAHERARSDGVEWPEVEIRSVWREALDGLCADGRIAEAGPPERVERLALEYECRVNPVWPMPGAAEVLADLRRRGVRLGIVSNAQFYTPVLIEALLGAAPEALGFERDLTSWSCEAGEAKPSTKMFDAPLAALRRDGIPPGEVLYVGNDMRNDVWTAMRAGCRTALFAGDRRSLRLREDDPVAASSVAEAVLPDLGSLAVLLGRANGGHGVRG